MNELNTWNLHSRNYLEMAFRAERRRELEAPDGYGINVGDCGDIIEMFIAMKGDRVDTVSFLIKGCMNTNACANTVAELVEGRTVEEAWEIQVQDVIDFLQTLPQSSLHCAELAVGAFYRALADVKKRAKANKS